LAHVPVGRPFVEAMGEEEVMEHLQNQLEAGLTNVDPKKVVVAYEPAWAISNGDPYKTKAVENPDHAERICMFIRIKFKVSKVLYGGSSDASNAESFLQRQIDGLLVGGASLRPDEFNKMITIKI
ncbi:MAG: triose-phosphate isomerase, partial [Patescibacteria group bacterium]